MRDDMDSVIVDRPRSGCRTKFPRAVCDDLDDLPTHESMTLRIRSDARSQGDLLGPLLRFLRKSVGRRWDEVYAEVRAVTDHRSILGHHLLGHVDDFVTSWAKHAIRPTTFGFFVDAGGVLRGAPPFRFRRPAPEPDTGVVAISESVQLRRIDGVWYEVTLTPVVASTLGRRDAVTRQAVALAASSPEVAARLRRHLGRPPEPVLLGCLYPDKKLMAASNRQLGKKELRDRGLRGGDARRSA